MAGLVRMFFQSSTESRPTSTRHGIKAKPNNNKVEVSMRPLAEIPRPGEKPGEGLRPGTPALWLFFSDPLKKLTAEAARDFRRHQSRRISPEATRKSKHGLVSRARTRDICAAHRAKLTDLRLFAATQQQQPQLPSQPRTAATGRHDCQHDGTLTFTLTAASPERALLPSLQNGKLDR